MSTKQTRIPLFLVLSLIVPACGGIEEEESSIPSLLSVPTSAVSAAKEKAVQSQINPAADGSTSYEWPWPLGGRVQNDYSAKVLAWVSGLGSCDGPGLGWVDPGTVSHWAYDVDHVRSPSGHWYKIGPHRAVIDMWGNVNNVECTVSACGKDCGK